MPSKLAVKAAVLPPAASQEASMNLRLRKATGAIHMRNDINPLQRKVWNVLLHSASAELGDKTIQTHQIAMRDLTERSGFNSKNVDYLREALEGMVGTTIKWNVLGPDGDREWGVTAPLAGAKIKNGTVTYSFSPQLRDLLHEPERWANLNIGVIRRFTTGPGLALYENCFAYRGMGQTPWFELSVLRDLIGTNGKAYDEFKAFNRVLKAAVGEVNSLGDIKLEMELKRERRQVTEVRFRIAENTQHALNLLSNFEPDPDLLERLTEEMCIAPVRAIEVLAGEPPERVRDVIDWCSAKYVEGAIKLGKLPAYFEKTLSDWDGSATKVSRLKKTGTQGASTKKPVVVDDRNSVEAQAKREARWTDIEQRLAQLSDTALVTFEEGFSAFLREGHKPLVPMYTAEGVMNSIVKSVWAEYVLAKLPC